MWDPSSFCRLARIKNATITNADEIAVRWGLSFTKAGRVNYITALQINFTQCTLKSVSVGAYASRKLPNILFIYPCTVYNNTKLKIINILKKQVCVKKKVCDGMLISFKNHVVVAQETRIWVFVNIEEIFVEWICGCAHIHTRKYQCTV